MKQKDTKHYTTKLIFLCGFFLLHQLAISQSVENISLPSNSNFNYDGAMTFDVISANNFTFLYSFEKLIVYNANEQFCGEIFFPEQQSLQVWFGKYNPVFYNSRLYVGSANLMAYHDSKKILYIVTPSLNLVYLNVNFQNSHIFSNEDIINSNNLYNPLDDNQISDMDAPSFKPLNGFNIIKCDVANNRLYWMIQGQNDIANINYPGSFHKRKRFLGLYNIDPLNGYISHHWSEVMAASDNYQEANISDIVFNTSNPDYFYVSKLNQIEIRKFSNPNSIVHEYIIDGSNYFTTNDTAFNPYYKFSKLLYINENGVHKIVALPYRIPFAIPISGEQSDIFIIDGNHDNYTNPQTPDPYITQLESPSHRITDAVFLAGNNDLIVSYAPDENEVINDSNLGTDHDIAIYHYDPNYQPLGGFDPPEIFNTNYEPSIHDYDINVSINLLKTDNNNVLISKKDEIVKLSFGSSTYDHTQLLSAENNLFRKGALLAGKSFINNPTSNGFEIINNNTNECSEIHTAYPAYHITADCDGDKLYLYNRLNTHGAGFYVCDLDVENGTEIINYVNNVAANIGDCIYNPFTDQFLVSEFSEAPSKIIVYNNDAQNSIGTQINLPTGVHYPEKMFIAPNKRLYVFANMLVGNTPHMLVYAADEFASYTNYQLIDHYDISASFASDYVYYSGNFCYNKYDQKVYATIHPKVITLDPYLTEHNSMYREGLPFDVGTGAFFCVGDDQATNVISGLSRPMKMNSPDYVENSQYEGKVFIIGDGFYVYDCDEETLSSDYEEAFIDIAYSPVYDQLYGMKDVTGSTGYATDRKFVVQKISYSNNVPVFGNNMVEYPGQACSFFWNKYDGQIYIHQKFDEYKKAGTQVRLIYFDPSDVPIQPEEINLGLKCIYPELDHNGDLHYFMHNQTSPYIHPGNNTIYLPNGGHSCVSKVSFTARESKLLENEGWTWLSFPRMNRDNNDPELIPTVLNDNIEPESFNTGSTLENLPIGQTVIKYNYYDYIDKWNSGGALIDIQSTLGYKLFLDYPLTPDQSTLFMEGNLYDHFASGCNNCTLNLTGANTNKYWVGYYYPVSQHIADAIPDEFEPFISVVKGQYYSCYGAPQSDGSVQWNCAINKRPPVIVYGDMVEIILLPEQSINNFYWSIYNNVPADQERLGTEYYSYTETSDYTPVFIELDTSDNPVEIGAFVNDSCIGGSTVLPEDSLVLVPAYTEGMSGEIYFEEYYGSQKSIRSPITNYYVINQQSRHREKRMIHTSEGKDYYVVSFNDNTNNEKKRSHQDARISCQPNPLSSTGTVKCYIPQDGNVEIKLYNMLGSGQLLIFTGFLSAGNHEFIFSSTDINVNSLVNGTYILTLKSTEYQVQTKIIVIQ
ncbi:MAG: T9SS type A sorting domain-containing protein [Bacteroidales bacterium]|nr:T9SS type A sorting domain-containing protein [Bacteroidales bacterium]